jgi:chromosomal replication initiation ATPase DnaA
VAAAETAADELEPLLLERQREYDTRPPATEASAETSSRRNNPFRECRYRLTALSSELRRTHEALVHADAVANRALLLLTGAAGTGKTHLLCDVARHRLAGGRPTVLLMGQRFVSADAPWIQALQQLDLPGLSAQEFVARP